jgi:hypothetical protein
VEQYNSVIDRVEVEQMSRYHLKMGTEEVSWLEVKRSSLAVVSRTDGRIVIPVALDWQSAVQLEDDLSIDRETEL